MRRLSALVALALLVSHPAAALDPSKRITQYGHDVWETAQGLPQNTVEAITQTRDGYLWLGTQQGLVRFDGARFVVFNTTNTPELGHNWITALREGRDASLWVGTSGGGLARLAGGRFTRMTTKEGLSHDLVRAVAEDDGGLWIGTYGGGLNRLDRAERDPRSLAGAEEPRRDRFEKGSVRHITAKDGLGSDFVWTLCLDRGGDLWIGTIGGGLARLRGGRVERVGEPDGPLGRRIWSLHQDADGTLWVGTDSGLVRTSGGERPTFVKIDGIPAAPVRSIHRDRDGNLWIGVLGKGLYRLTASGTTSYTHREGLSDDSVYSMFGDQEGSLWIGTLGGGLNRLKDQKLTLVTEQEGLSSSHVRSVLEDRDGSLWIGTNGGGLDHVVGDRVDVYTPREGLAGDLVNAIFQDLDGSVWVGTMSGVSQVKDGRVIDKPAFRNRVNSIHRDRAGRLWIGTYGDGLLRASGGTITTLKTAEGHASNNVRWITEDAAGDLWVGTHGEGLLRLHDGEIVRTFTTRDGLASDQVFSVLVDSDGAVWATSFDRGLTRIKNGKLSVITSRDGLFDNHGFAIVDDGRGSFWISSNSGIWSVRKKELDDVADGRSRSVRSESYSFTDGLRGGTAGGSQPSGWAGRDGRLWFATLKGALFVDPARIRRNTIVPPVHVDRLVVDGMERDVTSGLRLPAGAERVEISYTALSYLVPAKVLFRYQLEGYDRDFLDVGNLRTAYYTRLPPGSYTFRVKACNNDGVWNEVGAALQFSVAPRFHQTIAFPLLIALGVAGAVYSVYCLRVAQHRARERELLTLVNARTQSLAGALREAEEERRRADAERMRAEEANRAKSVFLANMSHELRTPLNAVIGFSQLLGRDPSLSPGSRENLSIIERSGEHLLGLINDVLSLARIESGKVTLSETPFDLLPTLRGVVEMLRARAEAKGLALVFEPAPELPVAVLGDEPKLRQILLNLLGNAVKFTERGNAGLRASWREGIATFEIFDTGPGIAAADGAALFRPFVQTATGQAKEGTGLGLAISRTYAQLMGGDIQVASEPGLGSTFTVTMRLPATAREAERHPSITRRVVGLAPGQLPVLVLVADDRADSRLLPTRLLSLVGLAVSEARDGHEAVERWNSLSPRVVFMDMRMPVVDGREATRRIRQIEEETGSPRTVVIALSASAFSHERAVFTAAGCDDFIPKPFRESDIFNSLTRLAGIRFTYEEEREPASAAQKPPPSAAIPAELREELRRAFLAEGDQEKALQLAARVALLDAALGRRLEALIRAIDLDAVEEMLR